MSKHTPGPWNWDEEVPTGYLGANWQEIAPWLVDVNGGSVLEGKIACPNQKNLALIAAAPDLLEALETFVNLVHEGRGLDHASKVARAAIAKARGEA